MEVPAFVQEENVKSISEFGAGVGHYGAELEPKFPANVEYRRYDGAGNVEEYTGGYVTFADLTTPLDLPVTEWIVCFEVGEHIPNYYEGMVIRNLHRHNTKGIILSWAILGQGGLHHVNNHSPEYMETLFAELGYTRDKVWEKRFRNPDGNKSWFIDGSLVFRRNST